MLSVGDPAPPFTATAHDGKTVSLAALRGKKVLLYFYPKADTPGCTAESCSFRDQHADYARRNVVVLGASFDTIEENAAFAAKYALPFPLLCDTERAIGLAYGACDAPTAAVPKRISYLIDEQGKIATVYASVNARTHPTEVLVDLG
jgi:peroxiredoxin Q/BCP